METCKDLEKIYIWPNGVWCNTEDLEDYLRFMSDDYLVARAHSEDHAELLANRVRTTGKAC